MASLSVLRRASRKSVLNGAESLACQASTSSLMSRTRAHRAVSIPTTTQLLARPLSASVQIRAVPADTRQEPVALPLNNPASRPYARHRPTLPQPPSYRLPAALAIIFSLVSWSAFTIHATNRERLSSSVLKNVVDRIKTSPAVEQTLGEDVNLKREMILAGDPYIRGSVNIMQGRVDMSFKVKGSKDGGTTYFSAIRREPGQPYETLRFLIVLDSTGETISLLDEV